MKKVLTILILLQCIVGLAQAACKITGGACSIYASVEQPKQNSKQENIIKKSTPFNCRLGICLPRLLIKQIYQ